MNQNPAQGQPEEPPEETSNGPQHRGRGKCKPHLIDCLKCKADGIASQAAYVAATTPDLETAQTNYDATRKDYRAKRRDVALQVQDMRHQIKHLVERVRCSIKQGKVVECLNEAWSCIAQELDDCGGHVGCCADSLDCDFDITGADWDCDPDMPHQEYMSDQDYRQLADTINRYQHRVDKAKKCFNDLLGEPAALVQRVAKAKAEIDAINAALGADPAGTDLKQVYAQALVARRHIRVIWHGFDEAKDFVECLCHALTCWSTGANAIAVLTGKRAFEDCKRKAREQHCDDLQTNTVEEILALYDKICPRSDCTDNGKDHHGDNDDDGHRHPCGCHKHGDRDDHDHDRDHGHRHPCGCHEHGDRDDHDHDRDHDHRGRDDDDRDDDD
jgi:hypothetical protein